MAQLTSNPFAVIPGAPYGSDGYRSSTTTRALNRGTANLTASVAAFGEAIGKQFGLESLEEYSAEALGDALAKAALNPPDVPSYLEAESIGEVGTKAYEYVVENVPNIALSLAGGASGAAAARILAPKLGFGAVKALASESAKKAVMAKITEVGVVSGAAAAQYPLLTGETFREMSDAGIEGAEGMATPYIAGLLKTAAEAGGLSVFYKTLFPGMSKDMAQDAINVALNSPAAPNALAKFAATVAKGAKANALAEGAVELFQAVADKTAVSLHDPDFSWEKAWPELIESALAGATVGGFFGAAGATPSAVVNTLRTPENEREKDGTDSTPPDVSVLDPNAAAGPADASGQPGGTSTQPPAAGGGGAGSAGVAPPAAPVDVGGADSTTAPAPPARLQPPAEELPSDLEAQLEELRTGARDAVLVSSRQSQEVAPDVADGMTPFKLGSFGTLFTRPDRRAEVFAKIRPFMQPDGSGDLSFAEPTTQEGINALRRATAELTFGESVVDAGLETDITPAPFVAVQFDAQGRALAGVQVSTREQGDKMLEAMAARRGGRSAPPAASAVVMTLEEWDARAKARGAARTPSESVAETPATPLATPELSRAQAAYQAAREAGDVEGQVVAIEEAIDVVDRTRSPGDKNALATLAKLYKLRGDLSVSSARDGEYANITAGLDDYESAYDLLLELRKLAPGDADVTASLKQLDEILAERDVLARSPVDRWIRAGLTDEEIIAALTTTDREILADETGTQTALEAVAQIRAESKATKNAAPATPPAAQAFSKDARQPLERIREAVKNGMSDKDIAAALTPAERKRVNSALGAKDIRQSLKLVRAQDPASPSLSPFSALESRAAETSAGTEASPDGIVEDLTPVARRLAPNGGLAGRVKVAATAADLPFDVSPTASALFDPKTQTAYIIADRVRSIAAAVSDLIHEVVGHMAMETIVEDWGAMYEDLVDRARASPKVRGLLDEINRSYAGKPYHIIAREFMAVAAQRRLESGPVLKFLARVRAGLRRVLLKLGVTQYFADADIDSLIFAAERKLRVATPNSFSSTVLPYGPLESRATDEEPSLSGFRMPLAPPRRLVLKDATPRLRSVAPSLQDRAPKLAQHVESSHSLIDELRKPNSADNIEAASQYILMTIRALEIAAEDQTRADPYSEFAAQLRQELRRLKGRYNIVAEQVYRHIGAVEATSYREDDSAGDSSLDPAAQDLAEQILPGRTVDPESGESEGEGSSGVSTRTLESGVIEDDGDAFIMTNATMRTKTGLASRTAAVSAANNSYRLIMHWFDYMFLKEVPTAYGSGFVANVITVYDAKGAVLEALPTKFDEWDAAGREIRIESTQPGMAPNAVATIELRQNGNKWTVGFRMPVYPNELERSAEAGSAATYGGLVSLLRAVIQGQAVEDQTKVLEVSIPGTPAIRIPEEALAAIGVRFGNMSRSTETAVVSTQIKEGYAFLRGTLFPDSKIKFKLSASLAEFFQDSGPRRASVSDAAPAEVELPATGNPYLPKDRAKSARANKFIGRGSPASSTAKYAAAWAAAGLANTGAYAPGDVVFISAEGARAQRLSVDRAEIRRAALAGVNAFITDTPANRLREYNVGEREVADTLTELGYAEVAPGEWRKSARAAPAGKPRTLAGRSVKALRAAPVVTSVHAAEVVRGFVESQLILAEERGETVPVEDILAAGKAGFEADLASNDAMLNQVVAMRNDIAYERGTPEHRRRYSMGMRLLDELGVTEETEKNRLYNITQGQGRPRNRGERDLVRLLTRQINAATKRAIVREIVVLAEANNVDPFNATQLQIEQLKDIYAESLGAPFDVTLNLWSTGAILDEFDRVIERIGGDSRAAADYVAQRADFETANETAEEGGVDNSLASLDATNTIARETPDPLVEKTDPEADRRITEASKPRTDTPAASWDAVRSIAQSNQSAVRVRADRRVSETAAQKLGVLIDRLLSILPKQFDTVSMPRAVIVNMSNVDVLMENARAFGPVSAELSERLQRAVADKRQALVHFAPKENGRHTPYIFIDSVSVANSEFGRWDINDVATFDKRVRLIYEVAHATGHVVLRALAATNPDVFKTLNTALEIQTASVFDPEALQDGFADQFAMYMADVLSSASTPQTARLHSAMSALAEKLNRSGRAMSLGIRRVMREEFGLQVDHKFFAFADPELTPQQNRAARMTEAIHNAVYNDEILFSEGVGYADVLYAPPAVNTAAAARNIQNRVRRMFDDANNSLAAEILRSVVRSIGNFLDSWLRPLSVVVRRNFSDNPAMMFMADAEAIRSGIANIRGDTPYSRRFLAQHMEANPMRVLEKIAKQHVRYSGIANRLFGKPTYSPELQAVVDAIKNNEELPGPLGETIRKIFDYFRALGVEYGTFDRGFKGQRNFFPFIVDKTALTEAGSGVMEEMFVDYFVRDPSMEALDWWQANIRQGRGMTEKDVREVAAELYTVWTTEVSDETEATNPDDNELVFKSPSFASGKARYLPEGLVTRFGKAGLRETDVIRVMALYIRGFSRSTSTRHFYGLSSKHARKVGSRLAPPRPPSLMQVKFNVWWEDVVEAARWDRYHETGEMIPPDAYDLINEEIFKRFQTWYGDPLAAVKYLLLTSGRADTALTGAEDKARLINEILPSYMNRLGSEFIINGKHSAGFKAATALGTSYQTMRLLSLNVLTQLMDPSVALARVGFENFGVWMQENLRAFIPSQRREMWETARLLGEIDYDISSRVLSTDDTKYGGLVNQGNRLTDLFFKVTGTWGFTNTQRAVDVAIARRVLASWGRTNNETELAKLNITADEVRQWIDRGLPMHFNPRNPRVMSALSQLVSEMVVRPAAPDMPRVINDKRFGLVTQLRSFSFGFHQRVLDRVWNETRELWDSNEGVNKIRAVLPGIELAGAMLPFAFASIALREAILGDNDDDDDENWIDRAALATQRSGILGMSQILVDFYSGAQYGKIPVLSLFGPTVTQANDFILKFDQGKFWINALPGHQIFRAVGNRLEGDE